MSSMQWKITRLFKKQKYVTYKQAKSQSIQTNPEVTEVLELSDWNLKIGITKR